MLSFAPLLCQKHFKTELSWALIEDTRIEIEDGELLKEVFEFK